MPGQPIVGQQHQAGFQRLGQFAHEFVHVHSNLGTVALRQDPGQFRLQPVKRLRQRGVGAPGFPAQPVLPAQAHAALQPGVPVAPETLAGQGVQHFVGENHAPDAFVREPVHPFKAFDKIRVRACQALPLQGAQTGRRLDQQIALRQLAGFLEFAQHDFGQPAAAGPQLHDVSPRAGGQDFGALARQGASEQRRGFRRGIEVSALAETRTSGAVIALLGVVQREFHVVIEREPAARLGNRGLDVPGRGLQWGCFHRGFI